MAIIRAKGFTLRPPKLSDAENIYFLQQDKEAKRMFVSVPKSADQVKKGIIAERKRTDRETLVIDIGGEAVGDICISMIVPNLKGKIGYWIAKEHRGKGLMTKVVKIATDHWFKKYNLRRIYANTRPFNKPSARVLEKAGFRFEGRIRKDVLKDGKHYDNLLFAKIR